MTTLVLGAHGPLGLAIVRAALEGDQQVIAAVQAPHRLPPALADLREEHPARLTALLWQRGQGPQLPPIDRALITELPIPPSPGDEPDDATADLRTLGADAAARDVLTLLAQTLAALQLVAAIRPRRLLVQGSWLGSIEEKVRGGGYVVGTAYAAHLMLCRTAALDLSRDGIATVVGNAGRYRLDMAGPGFHADVDDVARGLLAVLDNCVVTPEPEFRDWRGTARRW